MSREGAYREGTQYQKKIFEQTWNHVHSEILRNESNHIYSSPLDMTYFNMFDQIRDSIFLQTWDDLVSR